jgi:hypothetical protein
VEFLVSHPFKVARVLTHFRWNEFLAAIAILVMTLGAIVPAVIRLRQRTDVPSSVIVLCLMGLPFTFGLVLLVDSHPPRTALLESQRILSALRTGTMVVSGSNRKATEEEDEQETSDGGKAASEDIESNDSEFGNWGDENATVGSGGSSGLPTTLTSSCIAWGVRTFQTAAAVWKTTSMPLQALSKSSLRRMSPMRASTTPSQNSCP